MLAGMTKRDDFLSLTAITYVEAPVSRRWFTLWQNVVGTPSLTLLCNDFDFYKKYAINAAAANIFIKYGNHHMAAFHGYRYYLMPL